MVAFKKTLPIDISEVPSYKRLFTFTVDCFNFPVLNCTHYFLSHFHADHYTRLNKSFEHLVYCSKTTAELVSSRIGCKAVGLEMYTTYNMGSFFVRLVEANHCPGAVLFIFLVGTEYFLHTGDFRYDARYHNFIEKSNIHFKSIYLDNTYEHFKHFPSQKEAISNILNNFDQRGKLCPMNITVLCCSYCVGKEKIFLSIAEYIDAKVQVTEDKMAIYNCYDRYTIDKLNGDVLEIVNEKFAVEKTFNFKKKVYLNKKIQSMEKKAINRKGGTYLTLPVESIDFSIETLNNINLIDNCVINREGQKLRVHNTGIANINTLSSEASHHTSNNAINKTELSGEVAQEVQVKKRRYPLIEKAVNINDSEIKANYLMHKKQHTQYKDSNTHQTTAESRFLSQAGPGKSITTIKEVSCNIDKKQNSVKLDVQLETNCSSSLMTKKSGSLIQELVKESITDAESTTSSRSSPFDRLTTEESPIKVISFNQVQTFDVSKIFADKIIILCGTGWKDKREYKHYKRMDGKTIKNGIEIIYFNYSEHSSAQELDNFKDANHYENIINTVNNKG